MFVSLLLKCKKNYNIKITDRMTKGKISRDIECVISRVWNLEIVAKNENSLIQAHKPEVLF